jgi:putative membrane protein
MATTSAPAVRAAVQSNPTLRVLIAGYTIFWLALAISPLNRIGWVLEHTPTLAGVLVLVVTHRTLALSNLSYGLIGLFISLHSIGAHYGYAQVPFGFWMRDAFDFSRNHYDRIVHFSFGLLMAYPIREVILRTTNLRGFWAYYLPLEVTIATSGVYEVCEMFVAMTVQPEQGILFLGTQGDEWDAQKDMGMAALGALTTMVVLACHRKWKNRSLDPFR